MDVDKHHKIVEPIGTIYSSHKPRPIKVVDTALSRKGRIPKKLAPKLKKLEPNRTNLVLNSKNICSDRAKIPDPSISSGLYVKNKTIRVLLDSGSIEIY